MAIVMFDYDGVIVDSLEVFSYHFTSACQDHGFIQIKTAQDVINLFEDNVYASMLKYGVKESTINEILEDYKNRQEPHLLNIPLFKGMPEAIEKISTRHHVFIITSNLSTATWAVLHKNKINGIKNVIGADQEKSKIKKIQKVRALYPDLQAFYVGDTKGDMLEGRQAGARPVAVTWGWHREELLLEGTPDYIAHSPLELSEILS